MVDTSAPALISALPTGVVVTDRYGRILEANHAAERLLAVSGGELVGQQLFKVVDPDGVRGCTEAISRGVAFEVEFPWRGADGIERWVLGRAVPVVEPPEPERWVATLLDVSALKNAEAALRATEERLRMEDQRTNTFLAALSHELRNPLAPAWNAVAILQAAPADSPQAKRALEILDRQLRHLKRVVDDLLDLSRVEHGKIELQREPVDVAALVRRAFEDHRAVFRGAGVHLRLVIRTEPLIAEGDEARLAQVLANLLQNAAKFTPSGGRAWLIAGWVDGWVEIRVRDTGVGIAPAVLPTLFRPFSQGDPGLDRSSGGLGLGLALVKKLITLHGGSVDALSPGLGQGAEVVVRIPELLVSHVEAPAPLAVRPGKHRLRIAIIEDNVDAATMLEDILCLYGHEVAMADDGLSGLELVRRTKPELVLCDLGLPDVDGYEVARRLRADPDTRGIHLVALSGYAQSDDVTHARSAGFERHLAKPLSVAAVEALLEEFSRTA